MNRSEIIKNIAESTGQAQITIKRVLGSLDSLVSANAVAGEESRLGLFTVSTVDRAPKNGRNPATGATVSVPAHKAIKVKVSKTLKDAVNGGAK